MLKDLEIFVAVVEAGNFSTAARKMNVAVSSVTRRIDALEGDVGLPLMRRGTRKLVLTDAGQYFLNTARKMLAELSEARNVLSTIDAEPRGLLTIAAPAAFGRLYVGPAVQSFLTKYPHIQVELQLSDRLVDLAVERVDLAIRMGRLVDNDLVATRLAPMRRLVCASPAYLARAGEPRTLKSLLDHDCLSVSLKPTPLGMWTFPGVNRGAPLPVQGRLRCDDTETLLDAAVAGHGIVHLASWLVAGQVREGKLVALFSAARGERAAGKIEDEPGIYAVHLPGRSHAKRASLFIKHLRAHIGTPPSWDRLLRT